MKIRLGWWILPVFTGCVWLSMLLGMLLFWAVHQDGKRITPMRPTQTIAYISDIGAHEMQPLFISMGAVTTVSFQLIFCLERWLRHTGRLLKHTTKLERVLSVLAFIAAFVGMVGLITVSIFDEVKYPGGHNTTLSLFIAGYIISAIFTCWEYQRLRVHYPHHWEFRVSFWYKLVFIFIEVGAAMGFGICENREQYNPAAVCEWIAAVVYNLYIWSFAIHFTPTAQANKKPEHHENGTDMEAGTTDARNQGEAMDDALDESHCLSGNAGPPEGGYGSTETAFSQRVNDAGQAPMKDL